MFVCMHVDECELGTLGCVGRVGDPLKIFNTTTLVLKAGNLGVTSYYVCLSGLWLGGLLYLSSLSFVSPIHHKETQ